MADTEPNYNASFYSRLFNITERRIQQLVTEGVIPRAARGKYPLIGTIRGYVTYLQERTLGDGVVRIDYQQEKAGLLQAQREKAQLELAELKGELSRNDDVARAWADLVLAFRAKLLAMPGNLVTLLDTAEDQVAREALARDLVEGALDELASDGLPEVGDEDIEPNAEVDATAAAIAS